MRKVTLGLVFLCLLIVLPVAAQDDDNVSIHGFGSWAYGKTDGNNFFWSHKDGAWDYYDFALNINAQLSNALRINAQFYTNNFISEDQMNVDFAFVEYAISDELRVRAGKVKQPFGIYGDVKRVGVIRPFFTLPTSAYEHDLFVSSGFEGASILGNIDLAQGWLLSYEAYTGEADGKIYLLSDEAINGMLEGYFPVPENPESYSTRMQANVKKENMFGGKLNLETPMNGLSLGGSYAVSEMVFSVDFFGEQMVFETDTHTWGLSLNYDMEPYLFRSEYVYFEMEETNFKANLFYIEAGMKLSEQWQAVFRYEDSDSGPVEESSFQALIFELFPDVDSHKEYGFGVNYIASPAFIIRASVHFIDGMLWADPENNLADFLNGTLDSETTNFILGVTYSF